MNGRTWIYSWQIIGQLIKLQTICTVAHHSDRVYSCWFCRYNTDYDHFLTISHPIILAGIAVTSAGRIIYGELLWDPLHLIDRWDNRAAAFFASFSFLISIIGANISANSLSAANDLTAMFPKYVNIKRGQIICAILGGWALCPWEILASAPGFLSFMSGYTVFLGPFAGVYVAPFSRL